MSIREIDQVEDLIAQTIERFGSIDFLVNNAGGQFPAPPGAISDLRRSPASLPRREG